MSEMIISLFLGFLFTCSFFAISFFLVIGIKSAYLHLKSRLTTVETLAPITQKPKKRRKKRTPVRNIEINPEETTRIVVKKTG